MLVSYGGSYRTSMETALVKPFEKEFGVQVTVVDTPDLAKVKAQQMTGTSSGTSSMPSAPRVPRARRRATGSSWTRHVRREGHRRRREEGPRTLLHVRGRHRLGSGQVRARQGSAQLRRVLGRQEVPGLRTFRNRASETLEAALLADGVPPSKLYPLDLDRAFKSLERIKPHVGKWVDETPQSIALLERGEVNFSYVYASRVRTQTAGKYAFSFDQNLLGTEYLAVMKGAPNKANAMKFVQFAMKPERQAALMTLLGNIPTSRRRCR